LLLLDVLRTARNKAGLEQQKLAEKFSRPQSFVAKYENGERRIDVIEFAAGAPMALLPRFWRETEVPGQSKR
jgi:transcriptional regulator with XRE-family HTH domain